MRMPARTKTTDRCFTPRYTTFFQCVYVPPGHQDMSNASHGMLAATRIHAHTDTLSHGMLAATLVHAHTDTLEQASKSRHASCDTRACTH